MVASVVEATLVDVLSMMDDIANPPPLFDASAAPVWASMMSNPLADSVEVDGFGPFDDIEVESSEEDDDMEDDLNGL